LLLYGFLDHQTDFNPSPVDILRKALTIKGYIGDVTSLVKFSHFYAEMIDLISTGNLLLEFKSFEGRTQFKEAHEHSQHPGKSEKTILLF